MVRTLLFIKQILQVWYQNEEDIHLFSYDMLLIGLIWNISVIIGLLEVSRNFFAECTIDVTEVMLDEV